MGIFRPHNSYCLHIDEKSDHVFRLTIENIMRCYRSKYPGTYIYASSQSASVHWGTFSIVEAEMNCLTDLLASGRTWSYATNMAGSEVMMLTTKEMVVNISDNIGEIFVESY